MTAEDRGKRWADYYAATADHPPRRTLLEALARFAPSASPRLAVDLGRGWARHHRAVAARLVDPGG
jgi:hypothetical protein